MTDIEKQIEEAFINNKDNVNKCVHELEKVFVSYYCYRLYDFMRRILEINISDLEYVNNTIDLFIRIISLQRQFDDATFKEIDAKLMCGCFKDLDINSENLELFKNILFWTLTWLREDDCIETWLVEIPHHLYKQLSDNNMLLE